MKKVLFTSAILFALHLNAQINNGMILHLPFDNNLNDISTSNVQVVNNGTQFTQDRNGISNYGVDLTNENYLSFNDQQVKVAFPISISFWVKFNSFAEFGNIFRSDDVYNDNFGYWIHVNTSGKVGLNMGGGLGGANDQNRKSFVSDYIFSTGQWYHIVGVINSANDMEIYVDCAETTGTYSGTGSINVAYSNSESTIGYNIGNNANPNGTFFNGTLDQFVIWDRAINSSEITFLCETDNSLQINELVQVPKTLIRIVDILGREIEPVKNTPLIYQYSDGTIERKIIVE